MTVLRFLARTAQWVLDRQRLDDETTSPISYGAAILRTQTRAFLLSLGARRATIDPVQGLPVNGPDGERLPLIRLEGQAGELRFPLRIPYCDMGGLNAMRFGTLVIYKDGCYEVRSEESW